MLQHGVHALMSHEELELVVGQIRHELGVVEDTLAIGAGRADALLIGVRHTQSDGADEGVLQYERGLGLGQTGLECVERLHVYYSLFVSSALRFSHLA